MLHLADNTIGDAGGVALGRALPQAASLRRLGLSGNPLGDKAGAALVLGLEASDVLTLNIENTTVAYSFVVATQRLLAANQRSWEGGKPQRFEERRRALEATSSELGESRARLVGRRAELQKAERQLVYIYIYIYIYRVNPDSIQGDLCGSTLSRSPATWSHAVALHHVSNGAYSCEGRFQCKRRRQTTAAESSVPSVSTGGAPTTSLRWGVILNGTGLPLNTATGVTPRTAVESCVPSGNSGEEPSTGSKLSSLAAADVLCALDGTPRTASVGACLRSAAAVPVGSDEKCVPSGS